MNDIRRTILWVIFGFSMVLLWDQWQIYNGNKGTFFPSTRVEPAGTATGPASSVPAALPSTVPAATSAVPGHSPPPFRPARLRRLPPPRKRSSLPPTCCA